MMMKLTSNTRLDMPHMDIPILPRTILYVAFLTSNLAFTNLLFVASEDQRVLREFQLTPISMREIMQTQLRVVENRTASTRRKKRGPTVASSAFSYFRLEELESVASNHPEASAEEVLKLVEDKWERLDQDVKAEYEAKADRDKQRYEEERRAYLPRASGGLMKRHKKRKHPNAPKHPKSAFLWFTADYREKVKADNPDKAFQDISRLLGDMWAQLLPDEKAVRYDLF
jgi:hypothetical protein